MKNRIMVGDFVVGKYGATKGIVGRVIGTNGQGDLLGLNIEFEGPNGEIMSRYDVNPVDVNLHVWENDKTGMNWAKEIMNLEDDAGFESIIGDFNADIERGLPPEDCTYVGLLADLFASLNASPFKGTHTLVSLDWICHEDLRVWDPCIVVDMMDRAAEYATLGCELERADHDDDSFVFYWRKNG